MSTIPRARPREALPAARARLERVQRRLRATIDRLDDRELLEVGVYDRAGGDPIARWFARNTARQYTTAATRIRRARRGTAGACGRRPGECEGHAVSLRSWSRRR